MSNPQIIKLNVGGTHFQTTKTTLCFKPDSVLARDIVDRNAKLIETDQEIFIDRDPEAFKHILNLLRDPRYCFPEEYRYELEYFCLVDPEPEKQKDDKKEKAELAVGPETIPKEFRDRHPDGYTGPIIHLSTNPIESPRPKSVSQSRSERETKTFYSINTEAWSSLVRNKPSSFQRGREYQFEVRSPDFMSSPCIFIKFFDGVVSKKHDILESVGIHFNDYYEEISAQAIYLASQFYVGSDAHEPASNVWCIPLPFAFHPVFSHNLTNREAYKCALPVRVTPYTSIIFDVRLSPDTPEPERLCFFGEDILSSQRDEWSRFIWRYPRYTYRDMEATLSKGERCHDIVVPLYTCGNSLVEVWYYLSNSKEKVPVKRLQLLLEPGKSSVLDIFEREVAEQMKENKIQREECIYCWRYRGCGLDVSKLNEMSLRLFTEPLEKESTFHITFRFFDVCIASGDGICFVPVSRIAQRAMVSE